MTRVSATAYIHICLDESLCADVEQAESHVNGVINHYSHSDVTRRSVAAQLGLELELELVDVCRGLGIGAYLLCRTLATVNGLHELYVSGQLLEIIRQVFSSPPPRPLPGGAAAAHTSSASAMTAVAAVTVTSAAAAAAAASVVTQQQQQQQKLVHISRIVWTTSDYNNAKHFFHLQLDRPTCFVMLVFIIFFNFSDIHCAKIVTKIISMLKVNRRIKKFSQSGS